MSDFKKAPAKVKAKSKEEKLAAYAAAMDDKPLQELWVSMSNSLARAAHNLPISSKRIVAIAVAKMDSTQRHSQWESMVTKVSADEYAETYGIGRHESYHDLKEGAKALYEASVTFYESSKSRAGRPLVRTDRRWVQEATYHEGEAWISVRWTIWLQPHLSELSQKFISYKLHQTSKLRSAYSWKLMELLNVFKSTGILEITIDDFATSMEATETQRKNFASIRRKIIEPAVKELCSKDGWIIEWEPLKAVGKKVIALRFKFRLDPQGDLFRQ